MRLSIKCLRCGASWPEECGRTGRVVPCPDCGTYAFVPGKPSDGPLQPKRGGKPVSEKPPPASSPPPAPEPSPPPAPPAKEKPAPAPPSPRNKPCPACAEPIRAAALKCRYCGHVMGGPISDRDSRSNPFASAGLVCAFLAWPAAAIAFLARYGSLAPSLGVGLAVAVGGAALGCLGVIYWFLNRPWGRGLGKSLLSVVLAAFTGAVFLMYGAFAKHAAEILPEDTPLAPAIRQVLQGAPSGEEPAKFPMKCFGCGLQFEAEAQHVIAAQLGMIGTVFGGVDDIDALLDRVEQEGAPGTMECPECRRRMARPMSGGLLPGEPGGAPLKGLEGLLGTQGAE